MTDTPAQPRDARDLADIITTGGSVELSGAGTKAGIGHPRRPGRRLEMTGVTGVIDYDPPELVLTAKAGTALADIEALIATEGQMLAFEPMDYGPLFGLAAGGATLGGIIATNTAGPRRLAAGAARDHILGLAAVSGRGQVFKAGGRVVKNVTGYDLPKLLAGSWGTLAVMTEITIKVLPRPRESATLILDGLAPKAAVAALNRAMGAPAEVSGAAHLPPLAARALLGRDHAATLLRLEGVGPSIAARHSLLNSLLGPLDRLDHDTTQALWRHIRDVTLFAGSQRPLWRVSVPPMSGPEVAAAMPQAECLFDWAGGLVWLALPPGLPQAGADRLRAVTGRFGGHATLIRADSATRSEVPVFEPEPPTLARLSARVKAAFDPQNRLNPGRFTTAGA